MEDPSFVGAIRDHPRYHLRVTAIVAVAIGIFLNILAIAIARRPILSGIAFLPLCISMVYNHIDLHSMTLLKKKLGFGFLFLMDTLGFLSFLGLLIANGIVTTRGCRYRCCYQHHTFLLAYASAPWLVCCSIHGFIVLRDVLRIFTIFRGIFGKLIANYARPVCTNCRRDMKGMHTKPINKASYSQVAGEYNPEEDVERNAAPKDEKEQSPMRESSESTNETSRLFTHSGY